MARPTKYNKASAAAVVKALRSGATRMAAAEQCGIGYQTFRRWMVRYGDFWSAVTRAEAQCEVVFAGVVRKAATGYIKTERSRTTKTVVKMRTTRHPDGTTVEEPVTLQDVTETVTTSREFDWRAAVEWLKRRRRPEWGDTLDVRRISDDDLLRLLALEERQDDLTGG